MIILLLIIQKSNGKVEAIKNILKSVLQKNIGVRKKKLAFYPILGLVGLPNLGEKHNRIYPLSIGVWSGSYPTNPM